MRLIGILNDPKLAKNFSNFLSQQNIENQLELITNTDWGSHEYGSQQCKIWIVDEDQMEVAYDWLEKFQQDPQNPIFQTSEHKLADFLEPVQNQIKTAPLKFAKISQTAASRWEKQTMGTLTFYVLLACCLIFMMEAFTTPTVTYTQSLLPYVPALSSPVKKELMYDYPKAFEYIDKIIKAYGIEKLQNPATLPSEGLFFLKEFWATPYWHGIYEKIVLHFKNPQQPWGFDAPLFEKVKEGQVWRLFTPCLLHADIFHLFFNMIWLVVLGKQIEQRTSAWRYILFIVIAALVSNVAQYLMSGINFIGISGVLCAMLSFIWIRQKSTAWEGYQLQGATMGFMMFFIFMMAALQIGSFFLEIFTQKSLSIGIANTAHITGLACGYCFGKTNFFSWKNS